MSRIVQIRNPARMDLAGADGMRNGFQHMHEPIGDVGIWNGQFETGPGSGSPPGWPEGWEIYTYAGGSVDRVTGGLAGNYCMRGGQVGIGAGGYLFNLRYIPVAAGERYYVSATFKGATVNSMIWLGVWTYTVAKVHVGTHTLVNFALPGVNWVRYEKAFTAGVTAFYARVIAVVQADPTLTNDWAYVDDIQFSTMRMTTSPKIYYTDDLLTEAAETFTDDTAYVVWANSVLNIAVTEPAYIWYSYFWYTHCDQARATASQWIVYVDGAPDTASIDACSPAAGYRMPMCISGRTSGSLAVGAHTIDLRCQVGNAGDTVTGANLQGQGYYVRAT